jgi:hypothetical protein
LIFLSAEEVMISFESEDISRDRTGSYERISSCPKGYGEAGRGDVLCVHIGIRRISGYLGRRS